jgi:hypothetical protein
MRVLADENFDNDILRGLLVRLPDLDIVRAQDVEIYQAADPALLEWAARENRIVLTHDVRTLTKFAYERVKAGLPMPGVVEVLKNQSIGDLIDGLEVMLGAGIPFDFENQIRYIPLR